MFAVERRPDHHHSPPAVRILPPPSRQVQGCAGMHKWLRSTRAHAPDHDRRRTAANARACLDTARAGGRRMRRRAERGAGDDGDLQGRRCDEHEGTGLHAPASSLWSRRVHATLPSRSGRRVRAAGRGGEREGERDLRWRSSGEPVENIPTAIIKKYKDEVTPTRGSARDDIRSRRRSRARTWSTASRRRTTTTRSSARSRSGRRSDPDHHSCFGLPVGSVRQFFS